MKQKAMIIFLSLLLIVIGTVAKAAPCTDTKPNKIQIEATDILKKLNEQNKPKELKVRLS